MNLILITSEELTPEGRVRLDDFRAKHIRSVLKATPGQKLRIGLLDGPFGCGTVEDVSADSVGLACVFEVDIPPRPPIDLLLAMPRPKVLKRLWAQFAALGVGRIFITNAEKVERFYFDTHILEPDFYNARLIEGLQQARDTRLPEVSIIKNLKSFLESEKFPTLGIHDATGVKKILADPSGTQTIFQCLEDTPQRILLGVGPEGGWTPYELEMFQAHGFEAFSIGSRILRTDTACIGLISMLAETHRVGI